MITDKNWPKYTCPVCETRVKVTQDGFPFAVFWWFYCPKCNHKENLGLITEITPNIKLVDPQKYEYQLDKPEQLCDVLIVDNNLVKRDFLEMDETPYPVVDWTGKHILNTSHRPQYVDDPKLWTAFIKTVEAVEANNRNVDDMNWEDGVSKFFYVDVVRGKLSVFSVVKIKSGSGRGGFYWMMYLSHKSKQHKKHLGKYGELKLVDLHNGKQFIEQRIKESEGANDAKRIETIAG